MLQPVPFPVIAPLVRRHAEDAAFYWSQHDGSAYSPRLTLAGLARFSHLLAAHLEGLEVAGPEGWTLALTALERWKQAGETFVCAYLALMTGIETQFDALLGQVRTSPEELLRGVISALAWAPPAQTLRVVHAWSGENNDPILQTAALRAAALIGSDALRALSQPLIQFLNSPIEHVRSAACRAATIDLSDDALDAKLAACLHDPALPVRAEAAIALGRRQHRQAKVDSDTNIIAAETLWLCVVEQVNLHNASTGWYRKQSLRRLNRWVQHLAGLIPIGHPKLATLLDFMPARVALRFIVYHGDPAHLPYVVAQMHEPGNARYAGWVWQTMTGIDLRSTGMYAPEPESEDDTAALSEARLDADLGLPLPNVDAISRYPSTALTSGQPYLLGQRLTPALALTVLDDAVQAQRSIAAHYLNALRPSANAAGPARLFTRAVAHSQIRLALQIREQLVAQEENI
ncbi:MAG TPA: hypothetical protein VF800_05260 [Telluria sp.]|jgi:hypothetical protein